MVLCCEERLIDMVKGAVPGKGTCFIPCPGGTSYNTAIGRLGAPVWFWGKISTDCFGDILINRLAQNHLKFGQNV